METEAITSGISTAFSLDNKKGKLWTLCRGNSNGEGSQQTHFHHISAPYFLCQSLPANSSFQTYFCPCFLPYLEQRPCYRWEVGELRLLVFPSTGSPVFQTGLEFAVWPNMTLNVCSFCLHHSGVLRQQVCVCVCDCVRFICCWGLNPGFYEC